MRILTSKDVHPRMPYEQINTKLITLELQDKPRIINAKTEEFVVDKVVVETESIDTQEYIDSFKGECGIANIMQKFLLTKDPTLFDQTKRVAVNVGEDGREAIQDYANIPGTYEQAALIAEKAAAAYGTLPEDLRGDRSLAKFAETCTDAELNAFYQKLVAASKKEVKDDVK